MASDYTIFVGTTDLSLIRSYDGGESWQWGARPMRVLDHVEDVAVSPHDPDLVFTGCQSGLYRSTDRGRTWTKSDVFIADMPVERIGFDPADENTVYFTTRPAYLYRSRNKGNTWEMLGLPAAKECVIGASHPTAVIVDREDSDLVWVGVEVDGIYRSRDGGDSWKRMPARDREGAEGGFMDPDIHSMAFYGPDRRNVLVTTPRELYSTSDKGETWSTLGTCGEHFWGGYLRMTAVKEDDPQTLFVAAGDKVAGTVGAIHRSRDGGKSWDSVKMPNEPNSIFMCLATHPADPNLILASTLCGEVYRSQDGGESWEKLAREFSGIRGLAWAPNN